VDEKDDFTRGYGLTPDELTRRAPVLKALNVVNYAPFIEQAADAGDAEALDRYKLRLSGALDLYSI
jgi:hygromycin-B 4-O-kinase